MLFIIKILNYFLIGIGLDRFWLALSLAVISAVVYPLLPPDHLRVVYSFFGSLFFYETGAVLAARPALSEELRRLVAANAGWVLAGALAALAVLIAGIWREWFGALRPMDGFQSTLHLTGALGIAGLAAAARLLRGARLREALIVCGQYSMSIYVQHTIVVAAARLILLRLGLANPWIVALACTACGVAIPIFWQRWTDRLGWTAYFGIRPVAAAQGRASPSGARLSGSAVQKG